MDRDGGTPTSGPDPDRTRFAGLIREHGPAVHAYLARRAGRQVADDLFGEVWLRAWRSWASYDASAGEVRPWLIGIAHNLLRAHFRLEGKVLADHLELPCDPWADADERLDATRTARVLEAALRAMPEEYREILLLVAWDQLSPTEVAQTLSLHPGTVRSRLYRARRALKVRLQAEAELPGLTNSQEVC